MPIHFTHSLVPFLTPVCVGQSGEQIKLYQKAFGFLSKQPHHFWCHERMVEYNAVMIHSFVESSLEHCAARQAWISRHNSCLGICSDCVLAYHRARAKYLR